MELSPETRGMISVWKPVGPTSHDIVDAVRRITNERTVGHAGTLDPLAEGVLVIAIGRDATKRIAEEVAKEKEYEAVFELGVTSETDDSEGPLKPISSAPMDLETVRTALEAFKGVIMQTPPRYSAVKVGGQSVWKAARAGKIVPLEPRAVEVKSLKLLSYQWPLLSLRIQTGPGVYIRAIARDLGEKLGCGAYMKALVRTRVGSFDKNSCVELPPESILTKTKGQ